MEDQAYWDGISKEVGPWVVEWCAMGEQKGTFHIDTIRTSIRRNLGVFFERRSARYASPWIVLGIFETSREAAAFAEHLHRIQDAKPAGWERDDDRIFVPVNENSQQVNELRTMPYQAYLKTAHWQRVRKYALERAGQRCQVCNRAGWVDVHHRTYENRGQERFGDVIVLCRECHELFHKAGKL